MRPLSAALLAALVAAAPLGAEPFAPQEWRYRQDLPIDQPGLVRVALPAETLDAARADLGDLRLLAPTGGEAAFALERRVPAAPVVREPKSLSGSVEDTAMVFVVETGTTDRITALDLDAGQQRFLTRAQVEASDDGVTWRLLGRNLPVYDRGGQLRALHLPIPAGVYRHLRISLDRLGGAHIALRGISLVTRREEADDTEPVAVRLAAREDMPGETRLTLALPAANLQIAALTLATPEPVFDRPVRLVYRAFAGDVIREITLTQGSLVRRGPGEPPNAAELAWPVEQLAPARELILVIDNGDSPPLALSAVSAQRRPVYAVFYAAAAGQFRFYAGNARASAPRYDVGALTAAARPSPPAPLTPGPLQANPDFHPAEPLPEIPALGTALDVSPWGFRKMVRLQAAGVQQLELDPAVLARAQRDLADLRLVSDGRQIPFIIERSSLLRALAVDAAPAPDPKQPRLSRWRLTLPYPRLPVTRLTAVVPVPLFARDLRLLEDVEDERGNVSRRWLGQASWRQTPGQRATAFALTLNQSPATNTLWLETDNGDNPPITLNDVRAHYGVTRLLFKAEAEAPVHLYYGEAQVGAPRYDLSLVGAQLLAADKATPGLGAEEVLKAPSFADTIALAGRSGVLFWGMLALVVVVLFVVIARLLPKAASPGGPSAPN
ncbi:MAG TPA: DUF3999 family protein [Opitutaceae bacterium]|nr:DUF3999 family protein [Opitutaceae bacterium]